MNEYEIKTLFNIIEITIALIAISSSILIGIIISLIINYRNRNNSQNTQQVLNAREIENIDTRKEQSVITQIKNEYSNVYEPTYIMTLNEKAQYRKIKHWADKNNLVVFTKVRLLDLIKPREAHKRNKKYLGKIQSKHVDFVICNQSIKVLCVIEINDNSHKLPDRMERDIFLKEVLESCGYKLLMTYNVTEEELNKICNISKSTRSEQKQPISVSSEQDHTP